MLKKEANDKRKWWEKFTKDLPSGRALNNNICKIDTFIFELLVVKTLWNNQNVGKTSILFMFKTRLETAPIELIMYSLYMCM